MAEWLMVIVTLILVVITGVYVWLTWKMVKINQETLKISNTPEVRVFLTKSPQRSKLVTIDLCVQNIGTGFAFYIEFSGNFGSFQRGFTDDTLADLDIIKNGIHFLGPGKRYQIPIYYDFKPEDLPDNILTANVTYEDPTKESHSKTYPLNFKHVESYPQIGDLSFDSITYSLQSIDDHLRRIMIDIHRSTGRNNRNPQG